MRTFTYPVVCAGKGFSFLQCSHTCTMTLLEIARTEADVELKPCPDASSIDSIDPPETVQTG